MSVHVAVRSLAHVAARRHFTESDADLLGRYVAARDEESFRRLVERHGPMVRAVCRRAAHDAHAADDATQATFLKLSRNAGRLRRPEALPGWLYKVAHSFGLKARRTRPTSPLIDMADGTGDVLDRVSGRELLALVDAELVRLPESYRSAVVVCTIEGLSIEDAAARLNATPGAIRGWLQRGRETLRKRLAAKGIDLPVAMLAVTAAGTPALAVEQIETVVAAASGETISPAVASLASARPSLAWLSLAATVAAGIAGVMGGSLGAVPKTEPTRRTTTISYAVPVPVPAPVPKVTDDEPPLPAGAVARVGNSKMRTKWQAEWMGFTKNGKYLLTLPHRIESTKGGVEAWDLKTGRKAREIVYGEYSESFMVHPDGKSILYFVTDSGRNPALGCPPGMPEISKTHSQIVAHRVDIETGEIQSSARMVQPATLFINQNHAFSPDGALVAQINQHHGKGTVRLFSTATGEVALQIDDWNQGSWGIITMAFTPDSKYLAAVVVDSAKGANPLATIHLHDVKTGQLSKSIGTQGRFVRGLSFSADGSRLAYTIDVKEGIRTVVHDLTKNAVIREIPYGIRSIAMSAVLTPDGKTVIAEMVRTCIAYDVETGRELARYPNSYNPGPAALSADGTLIATSHAHNVGMWEVRTGTRHPASADPFDPYAAPRYTPSGRYRVVGDRIHDRDMKTGNVTNRDWPCGGVREPDQDEVSPDGTVAAITWDTADVKRENPAESVVQFFDLDAGKKISEFRGGTGRTYGRWIAADNRHYYVQYHDRVTDRYLTHRVNVRTGQLERTYEPLATPIYQFDVSPDGRFLAGIDPYGSDGKRDNKVYIWDVTRAKPIHEIQLLIGTTPDREEKAKAGHKYPPGSPVDCKDIAFTPDGKLVCKTFSGTQDLIFIDPQSGRELDRIAFEGPQIGPLAFDRVGRTLYYQETSGAESARKVVKRRDLATRAETVLLKGAAANVDHLAVSPDGKWLSTRRPDGQCFLWEMGKLQVSE